MAYYQTQYRSREPFCQNSLQIYCNKNNEEIASERKRGRGYRLKYKRGKDQIGTRNINKWTGKDQKTTTVIIVTIWNRHLKLLLGCHVNILLYVGDGHLKNCYGAFLIDSISSNFIIFLSYVHTDPNQQPGVLRLGVKKMILVYLKIYMWGYWFKNHYPHEIQLIQPPLLLFLRTNP